MTYSIIMSVTLFVAGPMLIIGGAGSIVGAVTTLFADESNAALIAMAATGWTLAWIIVAMARINKAIAQ